MIKETPFNAVQMERQPKLESDTNTSITEFTNLLIELGYQCKSKKTERGHKVNFVREIKEGYRYPRFHMVLIIPTQISQSEITSFHIDRTQHKTHIDYSRKNDEVNRLIKDLEKKENSTIRNELLCLFKFELLFGNAREINRLKGETQEERFGQLLRDRRRKSLQGKNRRKWITKKNGDKPCIRDLIYA